MATTLVLHAPCGAGHRRAAEALAACHRENAGPGDRIVVRDVLGFVPAYYRFLYRDGYGFLVNRLPAVWGALYERSDGVPTDRGSRALLDRLSRRWCGAALRLFIEDLGPDRIIATHFLPPQLLLAAGGDPTIPPLTSVVTDYLAHSIWVTPGVARYAAPSEEVAAGLEERGVPRERIAVTGIPVDPRFEDVGALRAGRAGRPVRRVLVLSGGTGVGRVASLVRALDEAFDDLSITVSAGSNDALAGRLRAQVRGARNAIEVIGMVNDIDRLYLEADVLITKPGGFTTTEAAVAGLPLILTDGIPGQETGNARHFLARGAALPGSTPEAAVASLRRLRDDGRLRESVTRALLSLGRPRAAGEVLRLSPSCGAPEPTADMAAAGADRVPA